MAIFRLCSKIDMEEEMEEKDDAKKIGEKAKNYMDQGFN
jgi:hypothetical protein